MQVNTVNQPTRMLKTALKQLLFPRFAREKARAWLQDNSASVSRNIDFARMRLAAEESAVFVSRSAPMARSYRNKWQLLDAAIATVRLSGLYCEFGVFTGESVNYIAAKVTGKVHGFDSFEGLPEDWRASFEAGKFKVKELPSVAPNVILHKGWFHTSIPAFLHENPDPIAFLHIDCDLYSSTGTVLRSLADRIVAGTVIQFDEFFNYPGWHCGEYKAFTEFCLDRSVELEYIGYVSDGEQLALRLTAIQPEAASFSPQDVQDSERRTFGARCLRSDEGTGCVKRWRA
jgi:hypothetical protein